MAHRKNHKIASEECIIAEFLRNSANKIEKERESGFSTARSLLKHSGKWKGTKEEYYRILKFIKDSRSDAEF